MQNTESLFILKTVGHYVIHGFICLAFLIVPQYVYFDFQNYLISNYSHIKFIDSLQTSSGTFTSLIIFSALCYITDFRLVKKLRLSKYYLPALLLTDVCCLCIANLIMLIYINNTHHGASYVSTETLNNVILVVFLIILKNWLSEKLIANVFFYTPNEI